MRASGQSSPSPSHLSFRRQCRPTVSVLIIAELASEAELSNQLLSLRGFEALIDSAVIIKLSNSQGDIHLTARLPGVVPCLRFTTFQARTRQALIHRTRMTLLAQNVNGVKI